MIHPKQIIILDGFILIDRNAPEDTIVKLFIISLS